MWPLRWFHYDEGIDSPEVYLRDGPGEAELMSRDKALAIARSRGLHLVPQWPEQQFGRWRTCPTCGRVLLPGTAADNCQEHLQSQSQPS
jgi:hypothetical protein